VSIAWADPLPFVAMTALFPSQPVYRRAVANERAERLARRVVRRVWARPSARADPPE
jgi:hypothetical protein